MNKGNAPPAPVPATDICAGFRLTDRGRRLLQPGQTQRSFLAQLLRYELYSDALQFLAHGMPRRHAIWWGCLCARDMGGKPLPPNEEAALQAAVRWVVQPVEDLRVAAELPGNVATLRTPAGCLAKGVFWSGGSVLPPNLPEAPPKPTQTAQAVSGAIWQASCQAKPGMQRAALQRFVALGMGVYRGDIPWKL